MEMPQIFLQHGVSYSDISKMIKPVNHKNFYITTTSDIEREDMIRGLGSEDHIGVTGLPRFDYLKNKNQNKIIVAFSWRASLLGLNEEELKESCYFEMLDRISKDDELYEEISRRGYKLYIKLHPEVLRYKHFFCKTDDSRFYTDSYNCERVFRKISELLYSN
ncbi:hypothetical protein [Butyrivibrio sp. VCD2006]|uniref:hypothetical protein n=1 Tax=Butyrivibrio sp. VCD2006 TaxID=1280664 RepID=UPI002E8E34A5|nr:hypothetical protein [Butyrivibrio sp. VCD2006]